MSLPADLRAEAATLTAIALDPACWPAVAAICEPGDFTGDHGDVARAMWTLAEARSAIDVDTLTRALGPAGERMHRDGVLGFMRDYVSVSAAPGHARRVRDVAAMRRVVVAALDVAADAAKPWALSDPAEFVESARHRLAESAQIRDEHEATHISEIVRDVVRDLKDRKDGKRDGLTVEWSDVNDLLRGLRPGQHIVVCARPGVGKTAIALDIARHLTRRGHGGHMFSLEMTKDELGDRLVSAESQVDSNIVETGRLTEGQGEMLIGAAGRLSKFDFWVDDSSSLPIHVLTARARAAHARRKLAFVLIDYLQLIHPSRRGHSRESEVAEISKALKALAKDLRVPVITCCQLNRDAEEREPRMSDLRESGAIENDADKIIALHRIKPDDKDKMAAAEHARLVYSPTKLLVLKNRRGPTGHAILHFYGRITTFKEPETRVR